MRKSLPFDFLCVGVALLGSLVYLETAQKYFCLFVTQFETKSRQL